MFLAFVPVADVEEVFYAITYYIQTNYPRLMSIVNYFSEPQGAGLLSGGLLSVGL